MDGGTPLRAPGRQSRFLFEDFEDLYSKESVSVIDLPQDVTTSVPTNFTPIAFETAELGCDNTHCEGEEASCFGDIEQPVIVSPLSFVEQEEFLQGLVNGVKSVFRSCALHLHALAAYLCCLLVSEILYIIRHLAYYDTLSLIMDSW